MNTIENIVYVSTQGAYVRVDHDTVCIDVEKQLALRVPMQHVLGVVAFGNVLFSPFALHRLAQKGAGVTLLDAQGRFRARLEGPVSGNVLLRQAQWSLTAERRIDLARAIVGAKIANARTLLRRGARESDEEEDGAALTRVANAHAAAIEDLERAKELDVLRGVEGNAARQYFDGFSSMIRHERDTFRMSRRSRRPPLDPINALLSFLYTLLTARCAGALEAAGLDPQVGALHALRPGRPALALDLTEVFRAPIADRVALTLINRRQLNASHFDHLDGGAVHLSDAGRRTVLRGWHERWQETVAHPVGGASVPLGLVPLVEARAIARYMRDPDRPYLPFVPR